MEFDLSYNCVSQQWKINIKWGHLTCGHWIDLSRGSRVELMSGFLPVSCIINYYDSSSDPISSSVAIPFSPCVTSARRHGTRADPLIPNSFKAQRHAGRRWGRLLLHLPHTPQASLLARQTRRRRNFSSGLRSPCRWETPSCCSSRKHTGTQTVLRNKVGWELQLGLTKSELYMTLMKWPDPTFVLLRWHKRKFWGYFHTTFIYCWSASIAF